MTVLDTSAVIDFLLTDGVASDVRALLAREGSITAPDLLVSEVLAVLRRDVRRGTITATRAAAAIEDLGDLSLELFPTLAFAPRPGSYVRTSPRPTRRSSFWPSVLASPWRPRTAGSHGPH